MGLYYLHRVWPYIITMIIMIKAGRIRPRLKIIAITIRSSSLYGQVREARSSRSWGVSSWWCTMKMAAWNKALDNCNNHLYYSLSRDEPSSSLHCCCCCCCCDQWTRASSWERPNCCSSSSCDWSWKPELHLYYNYYYILPIVAEGFALRRCCSWSPSSDSAPLEPSLASAVLVDTRPMKKTEREFAN